MAARVGQENTIAPRDGGVSTVIPCVNAGLKPCATCEARRAMALFTSLQWRTPSALHNRQTL